MVKLNVKCVHLKVEEPWVIEMVEDFRESQAVIAQCHCCQKLAVFFQKGSVLDSMLETATIGIRALETSKATTEEEVLKRILITRYEARWQQ